MTTRPAMNESVRFLLQSPPCRDSIHWALKYQAPIVMTANNTRRANGLNSH